MHCATRLVVMVWLIFTGSLLRAQTPATQPAKRLSPAANKPTPTTVPATSQPAGNRATSRPVLPATMPASQPASQLSQREAAEKILDKAEKAGIRPKLEAMDFISTSLDGDSVILPNDYHGKLVLVMFWGTWCPVCRRELAFWREAYDAYHAQGVEFLGIPTDKNRDRSEDVVRAALAPLKLPWPQLYEDGASLGERFGVESVPTSVLVDGDTGKVLADGGILRKALLGPRIERALKARAAAASQPAKQPLEAEPKAAGTEPESPSGNSPPEPPRGEPPP